MQEYIDVNTGKVVVRSGPGLLRAMAIGSCIVVCAFDRRAKVAGMAHVMLPGKAGANAQDKCRYAEDAIAHLFELMVLAGANIRELEISLVGAGNVLMDENDTICPANIQSVKQTLAGYGVSARASCLGGFDRKSAVLHCISGTVQYTCGNGPTQTLF